MRHFLFFIIYLIINVFRSCFFYNIIFVIISIFLLTACTKKRHVVPAFYYWQTEFELSNPEKNYIDTLKVKKLYVKFFDIDWDATREIPVPLAQVEMKELKMKELKMKELNIIPCVFITNRTFQYLADDKIEELAAHVKEKLFTLKLENIIFQEIQFDCDWTASTRDRFFKFLELFKETIDNQQIKISATIRLHQFRDFKETGVPPVDRGMLMFYNTGDVESWQEVNSILNIEAAQYYLKQNIKYPIHLDIALPIFSWGVLFRNGHMIRLINNLQATDLADTSRFLKIAENRFEVRKSTYLNGYYLYQEDRIRIENTDLQLLLQATDLITAQLKTRNLSVAFFHLDSTTIKRFPHESLEKIIHSFQ